MNIKNFIIILLAIAGSINSFSQGFYNRYDFRSKRHEINFGAGASSCLTDLGGRDAIGSGFLWDIDIAKTSYIGSFSYIYNIASKFAFRLNMAYLNISGDDAYAGNFHRNNRRLNFETSIIETAAIFELTLITAKTGDRYNLKGPARKYLKARKPSGIGLYVFGGIGGFYFEPSGYDRFTDENGLVNGSGIKYKLRPLHTEGQGLEDGPEGFTAGSTYSPIAVCIPMGFGIKKAFNSKSGIKLEAGFRFTDTDYLDDVSTFYYDKNKLTQLYGESAGVMSGTSTGKSYTYFGYAIDGNYPEGSIEEPELGGPNPYSITKRYTDPGFQRGNPLNDDSYMYITMSAYKKFTNNNRNNYKPIRGRQKRKVKASF
jgi:hypothetical protein